MIACLLFDSLGVRYHGMGTNGVPGPSRHSGVATWLLQAGAQIHARCR